jgi:uncharacterized membrane protein (GlpM family)
MKPNPFVSLKNFTVPTIVILQPSFFLVARITVGASCKKSRYLRSIIADGWRGLQKAGELPALRGVPEGR